MGTLQLPLCAIIFSALLCCVYFSKKRLNTLENKTYSIMLVCSLIDSILVTILRVFSIGEITPLIEVFVNILNKLDFICLILITTCLLYYTIVITFTEQKARQTKTVLPIQIINVVGILIMLLLDLNIVETNGSLSVTGPATYVTYFICILHIVSAIIIAFTRIRNLDKRYIPIFAIIFAFGFLSIVYQMAPYLIIISITITFINYLMYFTMENPDLKMIHALNVAKDQAEKANQAKTDFLSSMSHEIRTPLNAIVGFSSCIEDAKTLDEAKENAKDVVTASNTLLEIVNGILDISKIEAGKMEITNANYQAYDTFKELGKLMIPRATERGLDLQIHVAEDIPKTLYGDAANVKKVITNILSNAVKYTKKGYVKYDVSCVKNGDICRIIVSVEDTGRGIKPENIDKLFNKFERLDEDRNTTVEGTGLGLAITKQLVEMMGGKIIVQSVYGSGSKFTIILNQKIVSEGEKVTVINENESGTISLLGKRVLVVDDNMLNLKVAGKILEKYNPKELVNVSSGFECIDKIKSGEQFDLILMDDMMPKMSGTETLAKLKKIPGFQTPVVALTANAINGMREKYLSAGFNDYLAKPIEKEPLEKLLATIFKSAPAPSSKPQEQDSLFGDLPASIYEVGSNDKLDIAQPADLRDDYDIPPVTENTKDLTNELIAAEEKKQNSTKQLMDARIDVAKGLELLGDIDTYNDTAKDYVSGLESRMNKMRELKDQKDMANYAVEVHSLKSDSKYLGCKELADIAFEEEVKSKSGDAEFITSDFARLEQEVNRVREILQKYLETIQ